MIKRVVAGEIVVRLSPSAARKLLRQLGWQRAGSGWIPPDDSGALLFDLDAAVALAVDGDLHAPAPA